MENEPETRSLTDARTNAIQKVYEKIAETGMVTQNQLCFLSMFVKRRNYPTELLIKEARKIIESGGESK